MVPFIDMHVIRPCQSWRKKVERKMTTRLNLQDGFTLLEGMIAAVIMGIGLLALSGMQTISLSKNVDANETTRVTNLASDMIERIQFNRQSVDDYNSLNTTATTPCPAAMPYMARGDCLQWKSLLEDPKFRLTNVQGTVAVQTTGPTSPALRERLVTVSVTWLGSINTDTSVKRTRTVTVQTVVAPE